MDFIAIDVETANPDYSSICQLGIVVFENGKRIDSLKTYLNPQDYFDEVNISIHGITEEMVENAPLFPAVHQELSKIFPGKIVASHMPFDRLAITRAEYKYNLAPIECTWLDTARIARRAWVQFSQKGYGLANLASFLNISFQHHDAEEDARAAGEILIHAIQQTSIPIEAWPAELKRGNLSLPIKREGNPNGALFGEIIVFTGALSMPRRQAADLAAEAGCQVSGNVNKQTSILVVGDQDIKRLAGDTKSTKHRYAEELICKGQAIRIMGESDFRDLINL